MMGSKRKSHKKVEVMKVEKNTPDNKEVLNIENVCTAKKRILKSLYPNVWPMTSKDFNRDNDARLDIIRAHLKDFPTQKSFQNAIMNNRHLFLKRKVLVLFCGADILLPLWAAKIGADHVYAVDPSNGVDYLRNVLMANKLSDRVTIIQKRIEDIELPTEMDVIICNWMGYSLLFDSKVEAVIYARDKWLKKENGIIFPDKAQLYAVGVGNSVIKNERVDWWLNVQGFKMKPMREAALSEPSLQTVHPDELLTAPVKVYTVNLNTATMDDFKFRTPFAIDIRHTGLFEGILTFFDVQFSKSHTPHGLSTSPWSPRTNWMHSVFYFEKTFTANIGDKYYCGIAMQSTIENDDTKSYKVLMEMFTGVPRELSLVLKMTWNLKSLYNGRNFDFNSNEKKCQSNGNCPKEIVKEKEDSESITAAISFD